MRRTAGLLLTTAALCLTATACAATGTPTAATGARAAGTTTSAGTTGTPDGDCPLNASDLSTATGLVFELADIRKDHALETQPDVKALVCVYTSSAKPQDAGDPLVLRVDTVNGANAAATRARFESSCTDNNGTLGDSTVTNAKTCTRGGTTIEGDITAGDRTVDVYFVNATTDTAAELTRAFDKVLASVA
ncbi:hypothetical protein ACFFQW_12220 [Umezawaea endophytica]|uniref:DUF3558 domain-containing protein n=1 Tax=Umezawaea endophytica TaxID=1654476 RepID=A0A9X2VYH7_9PSEU|nr:hypothetical protein [Umezawaea endophytica]MCS7484537.1 hypothetical protein [Umezawaea endophytica]